MNEIVKLSDLKPVSFIAHKEEIKLTSGQALLLKLMKDKLSAGEAITIDDIKSCYYEHFNRDGYLNHYNFFTTERMIKISKEEFINERYWSRSTSMQWFKSNLGACIIKGKLLVIPIIEI